MFNPGDKVVCVNDIGAEKFLTKGQIYTVASSSFDGFGTKLIHIKENIGWDSFFAYRFEIIRPPDEATNTPSNILTRRAMDSFAYQNYIPVTPKYVNRIEEDLKNITINQA